MQPVSWAWHPMPQLFGRIRLTTFEEHVVPGALEDVVLVLAAGESSAPKFEVFQARNAADLERGARHVELLVVGMRREVTPAPLPSASVASCHRAVNPLGGEL